MTAPDKAFYVKPENIKDGMFFLCEMESHHASKVLRLISGDIITLIDGKSNGYLGIIDQVKSNIVSGTIKTIIKNFGENKNIVNISPALFKKNRFEILLEKATELGVKEIHPIIMERSVKNSINIDRCYKIIMSAAKQCKRSFFPIMHEPKDLQTLLKNQNSCKYYASHIDADCNLLYYHNIKEYPSNIIIGPEGGFTKLELKTMSAKGVSFFNLGSRRLRAETAGIASIALFNGLGN